LSLYAREPKLEDMRPSVVRGYLRPPDHPDECIFARTTACVSSDLKRPITPCQYGGDPDCTQCGCMASVGLQAIGEHRLAGVIPVGRIFNASLRIGAGVRALRGDGVHANGSNGHHGTVSPTGTASAGGAKSM
jgi:hypothetical protein